jgi:uncharacterized protein YkuJ
MNKILKITFVLFLSLFFFACSEEDSENQINNELSEALNSLVSKGLISNSKIDGSNISITYSDGIEMNFDISNKKQINAFDKNNTKIATTNFIENSNTYELIDVKSFNQQNNTLQFRNPDHEGQDFCECYKNDVDEFCDGLVGCVALLHPLVQAVIVTHCVVETGTIKCKDKEE